MKQLLLFFLSVFLFALTNAQSSNYVEAIHQGDSVFKKRDYKTAINIYLAAEAFDPSKKKIVNEKVNKCFDSLEALRKQAAASEKKAKSALKESDKARRETRAALDKANKLIGAFYFYAGRFALTSSMKGYMSYMVSYYFINMDGDQVKKLGNWDMAEPFDETGFAKVKKIMLESDSSVDYLIDTSGTQYRVAYSTSDLNEKIKALDISSAQLDPFSVDLVKNSQLEILVLNPSFKKILPDLSSFLSRAPSLFPKLWYLYLPTGKLDNLPVQIGEFKNLAILDLSYNNLKQLPEQIGQLTKLERMDLSFNKLTSLPEQIGKLKNLQYLDLTRNPIPEDEKQNIKALLPDCEIIFDEHDRD